MDNAIESMNAIDFKAFRKSLCEVVIIGWYFPGKEGPKVGKSFGKPHKDMVHETPFDDGTVGYGTGVLYRMPTEQELSDRKATVSPVDRISKSRHQKLWLPENKEFLDYIIKNPEGFMPGDLMSVPNEVLYWDEVKKREGSGKSSDSHGIIDAD